jgi:hypothetical protein
MAGKKGKTTHGLSRSPMYKIWLNVKDRCSNPKNPYFHNYGGRGIGICKEWAEDFLAFQVGVGPRPSPAHSLDRVKNDLGYEPGNVQWATKKEQANNMRKNVMVEFAGKTQTVAQWADELGMARSGLHYRLFTAKWPLERALQPVQRA